MSSSLGAGGAGQLISEYICHTSTTPRRVAHTSYTTDVPVLLLIALCILFFSCSLWPQASVLASCYISILITCCKYNIFPTLNLKNKPDDVSDLTLSR